MLQGEDADAAKGGTKEGGVTWSALSLTLLATVTFLAGVTLGVVGNRKQLRSAKQ